MIVIARRYETLFYIVLYQYATVPIILYNISISGNKSVDKL